MAQRRPTWKQDTPQEQLVAVISAAQGHLFLLLEECTGEPPVQALRARSFLEDAQEILRGWPDLKRW